MIGMSILLFTCVTLSAVASTKGARVIYGEDNRMDLFEVTNPLLIKLARSTAAMVPARDLTKTRDGFSSNLNITLEEGLNICPSENFSQQPILSECSGFLVSEDILVTAGHCFMGNKVKRCSDNVWVFDYKMEDSRNINLENIPNKNVYHCKKVIKQVLNKDQDFAIIQLEKRVRGRVPLKFRTSGKVSNNTELVVIGHPSMMPLKIADGGKVLNNSNNYQFITSLDTFRGNSGSAVFDSKTGLLEGILVSGKTDYIPSRSDDPESCKVVNICDDNGFNCLGTDGGTLNVEGEAVTRITTITKYL
jgi:hypothetical protein